MRVEFRRGPGLPPCLRKRPSHLSEKHLQLPAETKGRSQAESRATWPDAIGLKREQNSETPIVLPQRKCVAADRRVRGSHRAAPTAPRRTRICAPRTTPRTTAK